jgi:ubiquinone/menaquinone biosynthesis C-methylase UbiE
MSAPYLNAMNSLGSRVIRRLWSRRIAQLEAELEVMRQSLANIDTRSELNSALLLSRMMTIQQIRPLIGTHRSPRETHRFYTREYDGDLDTLSKKFPLAFPIWFELFENARQEYLERPTESLSTSKNTGAESFRRFVGIHSEPADHVLDVGCGPHAIPHYLSGHGFQRVAGIDPLPGFEKRLLEFARGFAEFLPWPDNEFDSVTIGTSLDHVLSLDMALGEVVRVLRPTGKCLIWVSFVEGALPYDPLSKNIQAIDKYHIFHFSRNWFVDLIANYFDTVEEFTYDSQSHFYALSPKVLHSSRV